MSLTSNIPVSVVGASGYTGMEALRLLASHPGVRLHKLYGAKSAGTSFSALYPAMESFIDLQVSSWEELGTDDSEAVFLGLPHGKSAEAAHRLLEAGYKGRIIDMSSDFRLAAVNDYESWYGWTHPFPDLIGRFTYGLTEWSRAKVRHAEHISNPGCFATAMQMGLLPFVREGVLEHAVVNGITGSSGSGASPSAGTHYSTRFGNVKAYKVYAHQHMAETLQSIQTMLPQGASRPDVRFIPVSGPFVRGIWMTLALTLSQTLAVSELMEQAYYNAPLVRLREGLPELKAVVGTAFTDIGWVQDDRQVVIGVAIDNLMKGAASQAIQNLNLMMDWPEETGLMVPPIVL